MISYMRYDIGVSYCPLCAAETLMFRIYFSKLCVPLLPELSILRLLTLPRVDAPVLVAALPICCSCCYAAVLHVPLLLCDVTALSTVAIRRVHS
ncbi:hypothetical protein V8E36_005056, partial [Tilletia maclaganii]